MSPRPCPQVSMSGCWWVFVSVVSWADGKINIANSMQTFCFLSWRIFSWYFLSILFAKSDEWWRASQFHQCHQSRDAQVRMQAQARPEKSAPRIGAQCFANGNGKGPRECRFFICGNGITDHTFDARDRNWRHCFEPKHRGDDGDVGHAMLACEKGNNMKQNGNDLKELQRKIQQNKNPKFKGWKLVDFAKSPYKQTSSHIYDSYDISFTSSHISSSSHIFMTYHSHHHIYHHHHMYSWHIITYLWHILSSLPGQGLVRTLRSIYREAGVSGLYAGLPVTMLIAVPANVLYFATYESLRDALQPRIPNAGDTTLRGLDICGHLWTFRIKEYKRIPVEIFVTKSEASGPLQNGFWLPFCAKFWPWVLPSCKWTPPWYRNFALEVRVCYPPVPTILSESGGLINNHYKLDGFKA